MINFIYLDFKKAYDKVSHTKLLQKIKILLDRKQCVKINFSLSSYYDISGISQYSVLGPQLFLVYINDLTSIFKD